MRFEFATATRILFGPGVALEIAAIAVTLGRRPLLVAGQRAGQAGWLVEQFQQAGLAPMLFSVSGEPTIDTARAGVQQARAAGCDLVVGLGGGSVLDAAKAIAALLANSGDPLDYLEVIGRGQQLLKPSLPCIAVPTTAGTGSEVTRNAVLGSPEHRLKASLRSPSMLPTVAVVDPKLTWSMPPDVTATTGLDALTQCMEPFVSARANPLTDVLCREGMRRAARSLRRAYLDGSDAEAREDMALASLCGGLALQANVQALQQRAPSSPALARYDEVARLLTGAPTARAADGVVWVSNLVDGLGIPRLGAQSITPTDIPEIVEKSQQASSMKANPIELSADPLPSALCVPPRRFGALLALW